MRRLFVARYEGADYPRDLAALARDLQDLPGHGKSTRDGCWILTAGYARSAISIALDDQRPRAAYLHEVDVSGLIPPGCQEALESLYRQHRFRILYSSLPAGRTAGDLSPPAHQ
ncbi:MAG: hypothetical protein HY520_03570 [Candidatus Aenigmarchaeota archaeon]|nr:hypothetical protein [Candidatus Aenigmarchaeota archaeon]